MKALAETAESLRQDAAEQRSEAETLREALREGEQREAEARAELEVGRRRLQELEALRDSLAAVKALAAEQEALIRSLEAERRPRRRWPWSR